MNTQPILPGRFSGRYTACGAAILLTLFGVVPVGTFADEHAATTAVGTADVSLSDLNLSTPGGMRLAQDRLHAMAERLCADHGARHEPPSQPTFKACVDSTVANGLRHMDAHRRTRMTSRTSVRRIAASP